MDLLTTAEIEGLRSLAERLRDRNTVSVYGAFKGGDPRKFQPDPECCTPEEIETHRAACILYAVFAREQGDVTPVLAFTFVAPFGLGTYTIDRDAQVGELARQLEAWIAEVQRVAERHC